MLCLYMNSRQENNQELQCADWTESAILFLFLLSCDDNDDGDDEDADEDEYDDDDDDDHDDDDDDVDIDDDDDDGARLFWLLLVIVHSCSQISLAPPAGFLFDISVRI